MSGEPKVTKNANIKEAKSVEKNSIIKVHPKEPEKKLLLVDIEQDKSVLRYLRRAYSMAPKEAIRSLLEEKKIQSIFAIYELFSDSRNGCEFGASEFTDKFIKSTIDKIPKGRVFNVIRKIMEADLLKKGKRIRDASRYTSKKISLKLLFLSDIFLFPFVRQQFPVLA